MRLFLWPLFLGACFFVVLSIAAVTAHGDHAPPKNQEGPQPPTSSQSPAKTRTISDVGPGDFVRMKSIDPYGGAAATDYLSLKELVERSIADDQFGIRQQYADGRLLWVAGSAKMRIVRAEPTYFTVRVWEGEHAGKEVYVLRNLLEPVLP